MDWPPELKLIAENHWDVLQCCTGFNGNKPCGLADADRNNSTENSKTNLVQ